MRRRCTQSADYGAVIRTVAGTEVSPTDKYGLSGDDMEAPAFARLAARTLAGEPVICRLSPAQTGKPYWARYILLSAGCRNKRQHSFSY